MKAIKSNDFSFAHVTGVAITIPLLFLFSKICSMSKSPCHTHNNACFYWTTSRNATPRESHTLGVFGQCLHVLLQFLACNLLTTSPPISRITLPFAYPRCAAALLYIALIALVARSLTCSPPGAMSCGPTRRPEPVLRRTGRGTAAR